MSPIPCKEELNEGEVARVMSYERFVCGSLPSWSTKKGRLRGGGRRYRIHNEAAEVAREPLSRRALNSNLPPDSLIHLKGIGRTC